MPTTWTSDLDKKLLLVALGPDYKPDWSTVATRMGDGFTSEGVRQHYAKLKKEAAALDNSGSSATADGPKAVTPKTPRKRKAPTDTAGNTPKKTRTPRKKKGAEDDKVANDNAANGNAAAESSAPEEGTTKTEVSQEDNGAEHTAVKSEDMEDA